MTETSEKQSGAKPTHRLYNVTGEGDKANWTQVGAAWQHADKQGFNIMCDAMPLTGRMVMRIVKEKDAEAK